MILQDIYPRFHRLPATLASTYSLQHTLENVGFAPAVASAAIDCLLGPHPESDPDLFDTAEWEPSFEPSPEDWDSYREWSDRLETMDALTAETVAADRYDTLARIHRAGGAR